MNINEQEMDAYEISEKIFSSDTPLNLTITTVTLKTILKCFLL